jgi:hypothetical protein
MLLGAVTIIAAGCGETCDRSINAETAAQIARSYFLSKGLAGLARGNLGEQRVAAELKQVGFTDDSFRGLLESARPGQPRKVGTQWCGRPQAYYDVISSVTYTGFDVYFVKLSPVANSKLWERVSVGINITPCGTPDVQYGALRSQVAYQYTDPCPDK